jgi:hypothetical protein
MRNARQLMALWGSVAALMTGAVILTTHAADQATVPAPASSAGHPTVVAPGRTATNTPATPVKPGAPQVPEESATIRDDPTLVPDPKQSADNSVSFPNDI